MNLKKIFVASVCAAALTAGAFAQNHTCGIDIAGGIVGYETTKFKTAIGGVDRDASYIGVPFLPLKINTYDCFLFNNHFGLYASIGLLPEAMVNFEVKGDGKDDDPWTGVGAEFMFGPAFGVDLGDSSIRFQVGLPFHAEVGAYFYESKTAGVTTKKLRTYSAFGVGLTPQFRFMANRRCSFVVGADFVFDFAMNMTVHSETDGNKNSYVFNPKNVFRFRALPYLGLGINFGN